MGNNPNNYTENEKDLKSSYYKLLSKNIKKRYDINHNDLTNQSYSLFDKDFDKSYVNQRLSIMPSVQHFIPWKSYLLSALNSFEKDNCYLWAGSLYQIILEENFQEQIKFQNLFFYQEAQILSNLKIDINDSFYPEDFGYNNTIKERDYLNDIDDPLLDKIPDDPFYFVKNKITNILMASFISGSDSYGTSIKKDPNKEYNFNKKKIKQYMDVFRQHLCIKEHPINFVITKFIEQFIPKIDEAIDNYKINYKINNVNCEDKAKDIIDQMKEFMVLIQVTIKLFYARSISYNYFKDEKDEFLNLVSFIIFNNNAIYNKFFQLFDLMNKEKQEILEQKYELLGDLKPEDVGIKPVFCLFSINENFKVTSDTGKLNIFTEDIFKNKISLNSNEPYYEAILYIKKIIDFKVPLHKLIVVASLSNVITGCVNKFWKNMDNIIKPEMLSIDSDELMSIFIYIIYKCKISALLIHADFIEHFITQTTKGSMIGYYFITFKGCLDFLLNVKSKDDFIKNS